LRPSIGAVFTLLALLCLSHLTLAQTEGRVEGIRAIAATAQAESVRVGREVDRTRPAENAGPGPVFTALTTGFAEEDVEAIVNRLPRMEIPFELRPPGTNQAPVQQHPRRSREQIFYLLQDFFERHEVDQARFLLSGEDERSTDTHGVLQLSLENANSRRLFLRLRQVKGQWKVAELRALP